MRRVEGALGREGADVQLVDDRAGQLPAGPAVVGPGVRRRVERARQPVHAVGLPPRARVGSRCRVVVEEVAVVDSCAGVGHRLGRASTSRRRRAPSATRCGRRARSDTRSGRGAQTSKRPRRAASARRPPVAPAARRAGRRAARPGRTAPPATTRPDSSVDPRPAGAARASVSPQPPRAASPTGSRVATVTAPPRSKASDVVGRRPGRGTGRVRREQLGPVAPQPQRRAGDAQLGRAGVVESRVRAAAPSSRPAAACAAGRSRPDAGCRGRPGSAPTARCPGRRREPRAR